MIPGRYGTTKRFEVLGEEMDKQAQEAERVLGRAQTDEQQDEAQQVLEMSIEVSDVISGSMQRWNGRKRAKGQEPQEDRLLRRGDGREKDMEETAKKPEPTVYATFDRIELARELEETGHSDVAEDTGYVDRQVKRLQLSEHAVNLNARSLADVLATGHKATQEIVAGLKAQGREIEVRPDRFNILLRVVNEGAIAEDELHEKESAGKLSIDERFRIRVDDKPLKIDTRAMTDELYQLMLQDSERAGDTPEPDEPEKRVGTGPQTWLPGDAQKADTKESRALEVAAAGQEAATDQPKAEEKPAEENLSRRERRRLKKEEKRKAKEQRVEDQPVEEKLTKNQREIRDAPFKAPIGKRRKMSNKALFDEVERSEKRDDLGFRPAALIRTIKIPVEDTNKHHELKAYIVYAGARPLTYISWNELAGSDENGTIVAAPAESQEESTESTETEEPVDEVQQS